MLIERSKYQSGDIVSLKLISGDEIVGRLVTHNEHGYELNRPCVVLTTPEGIGVLQAMFGLDPERDNLHYRDQHVISMCPTHDKLREHYVGVLDHDVETDRFVATTSIKSD